MKSTGAARWEGASGKVSAASGLFKDATYTAKTRFAGGEGAKNNCPVSKAIKNNVKVTLDLNVKT